MTCSEYKTSYAKFSEFPLPRQVCETSEYEDYMGHASTCRSCADWDLARRVEARGFELSRYPCVHVAEQVTRTCPEHPDPWDCADIAFVYVPKFDEYGIPVRDGGSSILVMQYCPFCGVKLPDSKKNLWFEELAKLGFDNPSGQEIPEEFKSDSWWRARDGI
jgi:hypothetical protein